MTGFTQSNLIVQSYYLLLNEGIPTKMVGLVLPINSLTYLIFCVVALFPGSMQKEPYGGKGIKAGVP